jgi:hypothetical protein
MEVPNKAKLAMAKILQVDAEFRNSHNHQTCDSEKQKRLAAAVKAAVDEFIDVAASLWPEFQTQGSSKTVQRQHTLC